ncbi:type II toxin-antitoxin system HipA family toxin [Venatoribacter cucullus]|uniref:type II toxin-antitoxin system HipA family toxin n=1 Tax=Venatoribacter cucullus TaxID=2661630 RepID=UPI00223F858F|nr:type II toxin-antitoxin system HipA family toxin [Venatoribacter cucullus]UZK04286.1 type II toxin-antitoxin system HipA family toxin [Venatoribacter cucullus]
MNTGPANQISVLKLTLHNRLVGYLAGFKNGKNILTFADDFRQDPQRPTLSLITHPNFPLAEKIMAEPWARNQRLHPSLSNLLPEGALRELLAQGLNIHIDHEFQLLTYLGTDLPGALIAEPLEPQDVPASILRNHGNASAVKLTLPTAQNKFSLAGVQMKFSMKEQEGRFNLSSHPTLGDWIIKTPSTLHQNVPANEFSAMTLAAAVGINIPEIRLIQLNQLENLPPINLPDEPLAFAIKRFDRQNNNRIHMEDFAQVLVKYPHEKYQGGHYGQIGKILYQFSATGLADAQQLARRLLVNILLANGDAHLKNWSLLYPDQINPILSPAYDILTTSVYMRDEKNIALNLGKIKAWYGMSLATFKTWAAQADLPWRAIKPHLDDVIEQARSQWPELLTTLPMNPLHQQQLRQHWQSLHTDFRI